MAIPLPPRRAKSAIVATSCVLFTPILAQSAQDAAHDEEGAHQEYAWLARAKASFVEGDIQAGDNSYWSGCDLLAKTPDAAPAYWANMLPLATPDEVTEWGGTEPSDQSKCEFVHRFWNRRAAAAGTSVADRLGEHFARLQIAESWYGDPSGGKERLNLTSLGRSLASRLNRPDSIPFDDRGLVYLRLGPPDRVAFFAGGGNMDGIGSDCYAPNESWAYDSEDGTRTYHFSPIQGVTNYRLLSNLSEAYICGDPNRERQFKQFIGVIQGQLLPFTGITSRTGIGQIAWAVLPGLYMSRQGADPRYGAMAVRYLATKPPLESLTGTESMHADPLDGLQLQQELAEERERTRRDAARVIQAVPVRAQVVPDLKLRSEMLQFAGIRSGETLVWLNAEAALGDLTPWVGPDGARLYTLSVGFGLLAEDDTDYQHFEGMFTASTREDPGDAGVPLRFSVEVPVGQYRYTLIVKEVGSPEHLVQKAAPGDIDPRDSSRLPVGNYDSGELTIRDYSRSTPELSDVAVAADSGGSWTQGGVSLSPSPSHVTDADGAAYIYFEASGLRAGTGHVSRVRLEPRDGDGEPFELEFPVAEATTSGRTSLRQMLRLDLSETKPGSYDLVLTVEDSVTGVSTLPRRTTIHVRSRSE